LPIWIFFVAIYFVTLIVQLIVSIVIFLGTCESDIDNKNNNNSHISDDNDNNDNNGGARETARGVRRRVAALSSATFSVASIGSGEYIYTHIILCIHIYTHTHTHAHTHTNTLSQFR